MNTITSPLLTDLYQLTMAYSYWKSGMHDREAVFHLYFRRAPFGSGYAVAAGLEQAAEFLLGLRFTPEDLGYLRSLSMFDERFLEYLAQLRFTCDVDAVPEGTAIFGDEPMLRVKGRILEAQLVETALLNTINFQTLIATKAARITGAAAGRSVIEFGLRRAQGPDGGTIASRAAFIGGCSGTSNVLAGQRFGIPVKGTHAHSWVMAFDDELAAFEAYAKAMPDNGLFLVDTYDTLEGVRHAIEAGNMLRAAGHEFRGIRLDSGDLAWLSSEARKMLDAAGFEKAQIVASNDLDEEIITSLIDQGAKIDTFGVGTRLVTAWDQPALGGVYKLAAIRGAGGEWERKIKVSEQTEKTTTPGFLQVRRFTSDGEDRGDMLWDELDGEPVEARIIHPVDATKDKSFRDCSWRDLLQPLLRGGSLVAPLPRLAEIRANALRELASLHPAIRRLKNPHIYPVGLEPRLHERRIRMIRQVREAA